MPFSKRVVRNAEYFITVWQNLLSQRRFIHRFSFIKEVGHWRKLDKFAHQTSCLPPKGFIVLPSVAKGGHSSRVQICVDLTSRHHPTLCTLLPLYVLEPSYARSPVQQLESTGDLLFGNHNMHGQCRLSLQAHPIYSSADSTRTNNCTTNTSSH